MLIWNLLLAVAWATLAGEFTLGTFVMGFVLAHFILRLVRRDDVACRYFRRSNQIVLFVPYFLWELIVANVHMAIDVLRPRSQLKPGVISIPVHGKSDGEITFLATLITLTPGTLSLDVSADRRTLYIHAMNAADVPALRASIQQGLERRVQEMMQ